MDKPLKPKRIRRICSKPIIQKPNKIYACRFLFLNKYNPKRIDENPEKYPNLISMKTSEFIAYLTSNFPYCSKCEKLLKQKNKLCFKHQFLIQKLAYIAQEIYGFKLNLEWHINVYGPISPTLYRITTKRSITIHYKQVLEAKELRIEKLNNEEKRFLKNFINFFLQWPLSELELLVTEHYIYRELSKQLSYLSKELKENHQIPKPQRDEYTKIVDELIEEIKHKPINQVLDKIDKIKEYLKPISTINETIKIASTLHTIFKS